MGWVADKVGDAVEGVGDAVGDVWEGVEDAAGDVWNVVDDFADEAVDWVDDYWREILLVAGVAAGGWALAGGYGGAGAAGVAGAEGAAAGAAGTLGAEAAAGGILGATEAGVAGMAAEGMAGFGGMTAAEMVAGAAAGTGEVAGLGSGMWGLGAAEAAGAGFGAAELGSGMYGLGIGAAEAGAGALGAAELGSGMYGIGDVAASGAFEALPAGGMQATGTLGAAPWADAGLYELGGGFYGSSAADIGALMGTGIDGSMGLGTGFYGVDLADVAAGNYLGDWGIGSAIDGVSGADWMNTAMNTNGWEATETFGQAKLAQPRNGFVDQLEKQGTRFLKNQAMKSIMREVMPQPQQQMVRGNGWQDPYNGNPPPTDGPVDSGAAQSTLGGLTQFANNYTSPVGVGPVQGSNSIPMGSNFNSPMDVAFAQQMGEMEKNLQEEKLSSGTDRLLTWEDFATQNNLQNGNNGATLAGYELWRALNSQDPNK